MLIAPLSLRRGVGGEVKTAVERINMVMIRFHKKRLQII
jgi:hypothetical protein